MNNKSIRITLNFSKSYGRLNNKTDFWNHIKSYSEHDNVEMTPNQLENVFIKKFKEALNLEIDNRLFKKRKRIISFYQEIADIEQKDYLYSKNEKNTSKIFYYLVNNPEMLEQLEKEKISSELIISIKKISYSSISFDLLIEPLDKLAKLFDNNFDLLEIFLEQYTPLAFNRSTYTQLIIDDISIKYTPKLKEEFNGSKSIKNQANNIAKNIANKGKSKSEWVWILSNTSFVLPVILSLLVLYYSSSIVLSMIEQQKKSFQEVNLRQENYFQKLQYQDSLIFKEYQDLISTQRVTYKNIINNINQDSIFYSNELSK
jgi:hypothetical protein